MAQMAERNENVYNGVISSRNHHYKVGNVLGKGVFGEVVKCVEVQTEYPVAIKIQCTKWANREHKILSRIHHFDPQRYNLVQYYDYFQHGKKSCLVFELLDKSLYDVMAEGTSFLLHEIRPVMHQMLLALQALGSVGIIHSDIKLDNIMFVNCKEEPLRVKLIDFGAARLASEVRAGTKCQAERLRAPEVILGLKFTEAIDMWSLGLVMVSMLCRFHLYSAAYEYDLLKLVTGTLGQPPADLMNIAMYTETFFSRDEDAWKFKTPEQYGASGKPTSTEATCFVKNLDEIKDYYQVDNSMKEEDLHEFIDLLKKMLKVDPRERITPSEALQHNYITMKHMEKTHDYIQRSFQNMQVCVRNQGVYSKCEHTVSDSSMTGLASGGTDTMPAVSDHSKNNTLLTGSG
ncbi:homeodomain-interacting protein kinase 2-like [Thalassophryne amazonica]|uniref:homeodomain-interacting protein kinase 2-like n=1 Tax=Thalassophryne amazonica TaxID=390379 RepID=UPI0014719FA4|nr:homeodomain-interacting protein kinase 2-like [Thalassophryne amazonica]